MRRLAVVGTFLALILTGCREGQETADCGKQGVQEVKARASNHTIVVCKNGKVFELG